MLQLIPIALMFVVMYFLLIRPQQKEQKRKEEMINNLKVGDEVVTSGGILATVASIEENTVSLKLSEETSLIVVRSSLSQVTPKAVSKKAPSLKKAYKKISAGKKKTNV